MQKISQTRGFHMVVGTLLILLGIGGFVTGILGHMNDNVRYIIGGIVLALIGFGYFSSGRS
jgi:hypothetical protein